MAQILISVVGRGHSGKSTVLEQVIAAFAAKETSPPAVQGAPGDQWATFELTQCRLGIATKGEPADVLLERLHMLRQAGCHVLLCAPRTNAAEAVTAWANLHAYRLVHWSTLTSARDQQALNSYMATSLVALVNDVAAGKLELSSFDRGIAER